MSFFKSAAKRPPPPAPAAVPEPPPVVESALTVDTLGQQLREALPTRRLQSLSLCDHDANVLWLSEGALGPDEHSLVTEALALLAADTSLPSYEMPLEDGRLALFLPVRAPNGRPVGIAMILADRKFVGDDTLERISAAPVRAIMQRLAVLLKPTDMNPGSGTQPIPILDFPEDALPGEAIDTPAAVPAEPAPAAVAESVEANAPVITAEQVHDILEFELDPTGSQAIADLRSAAPVLKPKEPAFELSSQEDQAAASEVSSLDMLDLSFEEPPVASGPAARATPAPAPAAPAPTVAAAVTARKAAPALTPVARPAPPPATARPAPPPVAVVAPAPAPAPPVARVAPAPRPAPAPPAAPAVTEPERATPVTASSASPEPSGAALNDPNLTLELLPFARLRAGGQSRRFQVLASAATQRDPAAFDALVLQRLLGWLAAHRASWNTQPTSFTLNLSIATLEDERFAQRVATALNTHGIAAETLGFEIAEALCTQRRAQVERFITACGKIGSWVVIDDFSFDSQVLTLMRSKALRLVKLDAKLTSSALKDKLSQAMVVATVQASKVLGIHCSAKRVDSQAQLQWLTAIGCDFAQGQALARAQPLDFLANSPDPTGISALALPS
ncbi:MAG: EAL domain-containing protein [Proteobacteria bacterium]|nr:EAL domain-containing protein [Pseudomonadota bacterium]